MHDEWGRIEPDTADRLNALRVAGGRVIAVGPTSLRLLASSARADRTIATLACATSIFRPPGSPFRLIDRLMPNFYFPTPTLILLVRTLSVLEAIRCTHPP